MFGSILKRASVFAGKCTVLLDIGAFCPCCGHGVQGCFGSRLLPVVTWSLLVSLLIVEKGSAARTKVPALAGRRATGPLTELFIDRNPRMLCSQTSQHQMPRPLRCSPETPEAARSFWSARDTIFVELVSGT